jgi:hypothetical protein
MTIMEIIACVLVGLYLGAASSGRERSGRHALTHGWQARALIAWEVLVRPAVVSYWQLRQFSSRLKRDWQAATPRYQEVPW